jgi:ankyrin repeat protein
VEDAREDIVEYRMERTPLHHAVKDGDTALVSRLLQEGADVNARDKNGVTPLLVAAYEHRVGIDFTEVMKLLLKAGADVNARQTSQMLDDYTPLHLVANLDVGIGPAELLLAHGADINAVTRYNETPLDRAYGEMTSCTAMRKWLKEHGAKRFRELKKG